MNAMPCGCYPDNVRSIYRYPLSVVALAVAEVVVACGGGSASEAPDATAPASTDASLASACVPGLSVACTGRGGCSTNQVCNASGSGFGPCECASSSDAGVSMDASTLACAPGTSIACGGQGGCSGDQICKSDGSGFGPCNCSSSTTDASAMACVPGQSIACAGVGGCISNQVCNSQGSAYGPCLCTSDGGLSCIPGQSIQCTGPKWCISYQVCGVSGHSYEPCICPDGGTQDGDGGGLSIGVASIASGIQLTPTNLVSDGTSLFWVSSIGPGGPVSSMPVGGGAITTIVTGPVAGGFIAVDDVNVYYYSNSGGIYRAPKAGGTPSVVINPGANLGGVAALGANLYWFERPPNLTLPTTVTVKRAPLKGGPTETLAQFAGSPSGPGGSPGSRIGATTTTVFLSGGGASLSSFPIASGVPDGGSPSEALAQYCMYLLSDSDAVYCATGSAVYRVASDGTSTNLLTLLQVAGNGSFAYDGAYFYWVDSLTVGAIRRVPKTGGTPLIIATATNPVAIAVDDNAVYWSDDGGHIMRLAK